MDVELTATGEHRTAVVTEKALLQNSLTRTYKVKARLERTAGVVSGMSCKVRVFEQSDELVIPAQCMHIRQDGQTVWVLRQGKAHRQRVKTSRYVKNGIVVEEGLSIGDTIITSGYQKLYEGAEVRGER